MIINHSFTFTAPTKLRFGIGEVQNIGEEVREYGTKPMIVTDKMLRATGLVEKVEKALTDAGIDYVMYDGVIPNPLDTLVEDAVALAKKEGVDVLIGVGGGGPMDTAKATAVVLANGKTCNYWLDPEIALEHDPLPMIAIPTTAGTGSEVTGEAVITNTVTGNKDILFDGSKLCPKAALLDPTLTISAPPLITASTGMDALTHAIEAYTCKESTPITDALALYAITLIAGSIVEATKNGSNEEARRDMMLGSLMAGMAFGNSFLACVHSLSETIGSLYGTAHGIGNAIFLPYVTEFNISGDYEKHAIVAKCLGVDTTGLTDKEASEKGAAKLFEMVEELNIPKFRDCQGIDPANFDKIADLCMEHLCQPANPKEINKQDFLDILERAYNA